MGSSQYKQLLKKLATGMVSITGALVFLVGAWILVSAFSLPQTQDHDVTNLRGGEQVGLRGPSSIVPTTVPSEKINKLIPTRQLSNETLALGCLHDGLKIEIKSAAKRVRLKTRLCDGLNMTSDESSLINRANGFEATLFNLEGGDFTSDYISLSGGRNQILFQIENSQGHRMTGEITILRQ